MSASGVSSTTAAKDPRRPEAVTHWRRLTTGSEGGSVASALAPMAAMGSFVLREPLLAYAAVGLALVSFANARSGTDDTKSFAVTLRQVE